MQVNCIYDVGADKQLTVTVWGFSKPITGFFQLTLSKFMSPRSTAPTQSFEFYSYDRDSSLLDFQLTGIQIVASEVNQLLSFSLSSEKEEVGAADSTLRVLFKSPDNLRITDMLRL